MYKSVAVDMYVTLLIGLYVMTYYYSNSTVLLLVLLLLFHIYNLYNPTDYFGYYVR